MEGAEKERREILAREVEAKKEAVRCDLQRRLEKSNLGARFNDRTFANFKVNDPNRTAFESGKKYCDNFDHYKQTGKGIYLTGPYGAGKTHLAAGMAHELLKSCHSCIFGTAISLFGRIKSTYGNSKEDEAQML